MAEPNTQSQGSQPGSAGASGGGASSQSFAPSQGSQGSGAGSGSGWQMPENFRGKSAEDIARSYSELEAKMGQHSSELGQLRDYYEKAQRFASDWQPLLSRVGYRPDVLAGVLDQVASSAAQQGDRRGANEAAQAAQQVRRWADLTDPNEQETWMTGALQRAVDGLEQKFNGTFNKRLEAQEQYLARFGEMALKAMEAKAQHPNLSLEQILQAATQMQRQPSDPIQSAVTQLTAPDEFKQWIASHDKELQDTWKKESDAKAATTFIGANSTPRPWRPLSDRSSQPPVLNIGASRDRAMADAKSRAIPKIARLMTEGTA